MNNWNSRPIFISSTFKDMQAERDYLHYYVFPALEERLRAKNFHLEPIDLRWGINVVDIQEQQEKEALILKVCLSEIERSRPFLIVMLGDRYGWIPEEKQVASVVKEVNYKKDFTNKSVTALEIEFGLFNEHEYLNKGFFYFRNSLPYEKMDQEIASIYNDDLSQDVTRKNNYPRLLELKQKIRDNVHSSRVKDYTVTWDEMQQKVTGLEQWGNQVLEDLWSEIQKEHNLVKETPKVSSWQDYERELLDKYVEERIFHFIPRAEILDRLTSFIESNSITENGMVLYGESGSGKSCLLSYFYKHLKLTKELLVLFHTASFSTTSNSIEKMLRRWISELSDTLNKEDVSDRLSSFLDLKNTFSQLIHEATATKKVVLLIDALDELEQSVDNKYFTWLPEKWPNNMKLIVTSLPDYRWKSLHHHFQKQVLSPLTKEEAKEIILKTCKTYGKDLHPTIIDLLLQNQKDGKFSYGNPLWLKLALDELILLDTNDYNTLSNYEGNDDEKIHFMLVKIASSFSGDVPALFASLLSRVEKVFGKQLTKQIICLIYISRQGLREKDLELIVPTLTGQNWEKVQFALIRRYLRTHLIKRGALHFWNFYHRQAFKAIEKKYDLTEVKRQDLHCKIGNYLKELPNTDPLKQNEYMYHLLSCRNKEEIIGYYSSNLPENSLKLANETITKFLGQCTVEERKVKLAWILSFLKEPAIEKEQLFTIVSRYLNQLYYSLSNTLAVEECLQFLCTVEQALIKLIEMELENKEELQKELSNLYDLIGDLYHGIGNTNKIKDYYLKALTIRTQLYHHNHHKYEGLVAASHDRLAAAYRLLGNQEKARNSYEIAYNNFKNLINKNNEIDYVKSRYFWVVTMNLGDVLLEQGKITLAANLYYEGFTILNKIYDHFSENPVVTRDLAITLNKIGTIFRYQYNNDLSIKYYKNSLAIRKYLLSQDPENPVYLKDVWISMFHIADFYEENNEKQKAIEHYELGHTIAKQLVSDFQNDYEKLKDLVLSYYKIGSMYLNNNEFKAKEFLQLGLQYITQLLKIDGNNAEYKVSYCLLCYEYSRTLNDPYQKVEYLSEANGMLANLITHDETNTFYKRLEAKLRLENTAALRITVNREDLRIHIPLNKVIALNYEDWKSCYIDLMHLHLT